MIMQRGHATVGVEYCDHQIRAVRTTRIKKQIYINATAVVAVQHASQKGLLAALTTVRQRLNYKREPTIFALNHNDTITKIMNIDTTLNDHEIMTYLTTQTTHIFGYSSNAIFIDYLPMATSPESPQQIQAVAARRKKINLLRTLFAASHFKLKAIDVDAFAIGRIFPSLDKNHYHNNFIAIAYLKQQQLLLCVFNNAINIYATTVDYPQQNANQPETSICTALNYALQLFNNARPGCIISKLILMGNTNYLQSTLQSLSTKTSFEVSLARIDSQHLKVSPLDPRLFCSFGASLWQARQ